MKIFTNLLIALFSITVSLSTLARDSYEELKVNPEFDEKFSIDLETTDIDGVGVDPKAWHHLTDDNLGYLRVQYSIINDSEKTMYGHQWTIKVEGEAFSEDVIALLEPGQLKTFSQLVFGGVIQHSGNSINPVSFGITPTYNNSLGGNNNSLFCAEYTPWCSTPAGAAATSAAHNICNSKCTKQGSTGKAICLPTVITINDEQCVVDTISCQCDNGNNPESVLSLPEIARDRNLDPYIRTIFQDESPLDSRPNDILE